LRDVFFNPVVIAKSESKIALSQGEGCLSVGRNIKNQSGAVYRHKRIVIEAYSYFEKKVKRYDLKDYPAIVAQHELDHLDESHGSLGSILSINNFPSKWSNS
ncbi:peptide deformylase, partial [Mycoplasmopsis bovis]|uniref:peptide deformylase n=1 Tax=Mycoplasmopsis bovis TaxID=28903 RepID=UPI003D26D936